MIITTFKGGKTRIIFRSIGSLFKIQNIFLKVKKSKLKKHCSGCFFENSDKKSKCSQYKDITGYCYATGRKDNQNVIFVRYQNIFFIIFNFFKKLFKRGLK